MDYYDNDNDKVVPHPEPHEPHEPYNPYNNSDVYPQDTTGYQLVLWIFLLYCMGRVTYEMYACCKDMCKNLTTTSCICKLHVEKIKESGLSELLLSECPICLESFVVNDSIITLSCRHVFHSECLHEWLPNNLSCPVCRLDLTQSE